jgi:hypothetical protein
MLQIRTYWRARHWKAHSTLAFVLLLGLSQSAATAKTAPATQPPTFEIVFPNHSYPSPVTSMLEFDIRNQNLILFDADGKTATTARLQNGNFEEHLADGSYISINLSDVQYFDFYNEQPNRALATVKWITAGAATSSMGLLQVFEFRSGQAVVTQQIRFNRLGDGAGSSFDPGTLQLTVRGIHGWEHNANSSIDVGKFRWDGNKFVLLKTPSSSRH